VFDLERKGVPGKNGGQKRASKRKAEGSPDRKGIDQDEEKVLKKIRTIAPLKTVPRPKKAVKKKVKANPKTKTKAGSRLLLTYLPLF
jgi:hypothetical protein